MNIVMNSSSSAMVGRILLIARMRSKPSTPKALAMNTSAMPPTLMRSRSRYLPKTVGFFIAGIAPTRRPYLERVAACQGYDDASSRRMRKRARRESCGRFGADTSRANQPAASSTGSRTQKRSPAPISKEPRGFQKRSGSDLLSHAVSRGVPSALEGLTSVFGMGTGVTPPI